MGEKACVMVVDGGSCASLVSSTLVEEWKIRYAKHPKSYKFQWANKCGKLKVNRQALASIEIDRYKDEVLCEWKKERICDSERWCETLTYSYDS